MRCLLLLIPAIALALAPQRPEQAPPPSAQVSLNVVALDAKGQNVLDLTAADFQVLDNGKPQSIVSFRRHQAGQPQSAPLGPRQYSNRSAAGLPHATVILFDLMNMRFEDRAYVFNQLSHSLQQFESSAYLYLYLITVNNTLYPVRGLPGNQGETADQGPWTGDIQARLNEAIKATFGMRPIDLDIDTRVRATFSTLSMVAARLAAVPGRKNIVWITHGVPISLAPNRTLTGDWIDYTPYVRQLSNTLDRADTSIYAVQQSPPGSLQNQGADMGRSLPGESAPASPMAGMGSEETLAEFASLTGGRAYQNNDIVGAIKQAVNDAKQSYLLSYAPPPENWDGKFHKLRVTCRRKGVKLQTRQGYYAFAEQGASGKQVQDAMEAAILSPFDAAEVGLRATSSLLTADAPAVHLEIRIDLADVKLTPEAGAFTGQLAVRFVEYQSDGAMRQSKPATLSLHLTPEQRGEALKEGYVLTQDLSVSPQTQKIRVIVFDDESAAIGSLSIPFVK